MSAFIKYILCAFFLFLSIYGSAQPCNVDKGFQTMYWYKNVDNFGSLAEIDDWNIKDLYKDTNGNIITWGIVQYIDQYGMYRKCKLLSKKTPKGTTLWSKMFVDDQGIATISLTNDNGMLIMLGEANEPTLVKLTSEGIVEWASHIKNNDIRFYGGFHAKLLQLKNGNYIRVGNSTRSGNNVSGFISCTDKNGVLLWNKFFDDVRFANLKFVGGSGRDAKVIELQDGNILVSGWNNYSVDSLMLNVAPRFYLQKRNPSTGAVLWSCFLVPKDSISLIAESSFDIHELPDRTIHMHLNRSPKIPRYDPPPSNTYYHLDASGNFIEGKKIILNSTDSLEAYYADTDAQGNDIFMAEVTGNTNAHILFKESNDQVVWAKSYHSSLSNGSLTKITAAIVSNSSYIMAGSVLTHNLSGNTGKDEYQNYLIKTDAFGNTNCSDTFSVPFKIVKADTVVQYPASWYEISGMKSNPVTVSMQDLIPYEIHDCLLTNACCTNTIRYVDTVLCNKATYTLPNNTTTTQPGIYTSYFQKAKGCDSVVYTTLTQAGIPSIQLGNDTCLLGASNFLLTPQTNNSAFSSFIWQDGSHDSLFNISKPGLYWVKASSTCGSASDSIRVYDNCNLPIYIPSAFTPNGDGLNDVFRISNMGNQELIDFSIYNRYGQLVFKTTNPKQGWNGKLSSYDQQISTLVYLVRYKDLTGKLQSVKGTVTLIR
jgi:gliding motility-associated-like protein